jgi:hypothetical protein
MSLFRQTLLALLLERHAISQELVRKILAWRHPVGRPLPLPDESLPETELQSRALARWPVSFALAVSAVSGFVPV